MTRDGFLGWAVLLSLLIAMSAALVTPPLRRVERVLGLGRARLPLRGVTIAAGAFALWYAIPLLVHRLYGGS
jgi:hypothetical protein